MVHRSYPETRYVKTDDGFHIAYQVFGNGPYDLVVNSGWMSNVDANWDLPAEAGFLKGFARNSRVIVFDRRGFGVSDRPGSTEEMSLEKGMDDMRTVLDAVGSKRAVVYGMESGGAVSIMFAASYPERTLALVLMAPLVKYWRTPDFPWGFTQEDARRWDEWIDGAWGTAELWRWNLESEWFPESEEFPFTEESLQAWARWSRLCASPQAALAIETVEREVDVRALLPHIGVPTLVMLKAGEVGGFWGAGRWVAEQIPGARYVELPGPMHIPMGEDIHQYEEIDAFVSGIREEEAAFDRVLATVLFTDIVESTQRAVELGDRLWRELIEKHHATVRSLLARYRGREVDTAGDGFFATFDGPARAVRCAEKIVQAVRTLGLEVRAGVHTGEVQTIGRKVGGLGVVIGARIGAIAGPSQVFVSQTVKDLVAGSGLQFEDRGTHTLKGVPDSWRLYSVAARS